MAFLTLRAGEHQRHGNTPLKSERVRRDNEKAPKGGPPSATTERGTTAALKRERYLLERGQSDPSLRHSKTDKSGYTSSNRAPLKGLPSSRTGTTTRQHLLKLSTKTRYSQRLRGSIGIEAAGNYGANAIGTTKQTTTNQTSRAPIEQTQEGIDGPSVHAHPQWQVAEQAADRRSSDNSAEVAAQHSRPATASSTTGQTEQNDSTGPSIGETRAINTRSGRLSKGKPLSPRRQSYSNAASKAQRALPGRMLLVGSSVGSSGSGGEGSAASIFSQRQKEDAVAREPAQPQQKRPKSSDQAPQLRKSRVLTVKSLKAEESVDSDKVSDVKFGKERIEELSSYYLENPHRTSRENEKEVPEDEGEDPDGGDVHRVVMPGPSPSLALEDEIMNEMVVKVRALKRVESPPLPGLLEAQVELAEYIGKEK